MILPFDGVYQKVKFSQRKNIPNAYSYAFSVYTYIIELNNSDKDLGFEGADFDAYRDPSFAFFTVM